MGNLSAWTPTAARALLLAAVFVALQQQAVLGQSCGNPYDTTDDSAALENCLDDVNATVSLTAGVVGVGGYYGYRVHSTVTVQANNVTLTRSGGSGYAVLVGYGSASSPHGLYQNAAARILEAHVSGFTISHIRIVGLKDLSLEAQSGWNCSEHQNAWFTGSFAVDDVISEKAICGSALAVSGSFEVENSKFLNNGYEQGGSTYPSWADGLTVHDCDYGSSVHDNEMIDSTDVGLVIGGGAGCTLSYNLIRNNYGTSGHHAFAGIHVGWFPGGDGDHGANTIEYNTVESGYEGMAFGLVVGFAPWWDTSQGEADIRWVFDAGTIVNNTISGAVVNLAIEGIDDGTILYNSVSGSDGNWHLGSLCNAGSYDFTAHRMGDATVQGGWDAVWFELDRCGEWDTGVPWLGSPGTLAHDRGYLLPGWELDSENGNYHLAYQGDGNLVLYDSGYGVVWATNLLQNPDIALMQSDGNFVVYGDGDIFATNTDGHIGAFLCIQNDGNLVVYSADGQVLWVRPI